MLVLHRPLLPRLISASVAAAVLAIVLSLALALASASSLSNSEPANGTGVSAHRTAPAPTSGVQRTTLPRGASDPFASLLSRPLPQPWLTARP